MTDTADLIDLARRDYGELITHITVFPDRLGIDAHLIGGEVRQYFPNIGRYEPSISLMVRAGRAFASWRGYCRRHW